MTTLGTKTSSLVERRAVPRKQLTSYLPAIDLRDGELVAYIVDISPAGMMLMSRRPLVRGLRMALQTHWTVDGSYSGWAQFVAQARWCRPDTNPAFHVAGVEIKRLSQRSHASLEALCSTLP